MTKHKLNLDVLRDANIPKKFWPLGVETYFGKTSALKLSQRYVDRFENAFAKGTGLLFLGSPKTCKTFLATYVLKCVALLNAEVLYVSLDELFEAYTSGDSAGANFISRFKSIKLLCVDNLGHTDPTTKGKRNAVEKLITYRSDNGLPYLICTELNDYEDLSSNYGSKVASCFETDLVEVVCSLPDPMAAKHSAAKAKQEFYAD